jgi:hypothetical protein
MDPALLSCNLEQSCWIELAFPLTSVISVAFRFYFSYSGTSTTTSNFQNVNIYPIKYSCPSASLDYIVEPWFLGPGATSPGGPEFNEWAESSKKAYGTVFGTSIQELPEPKEPRCALISGRTADNPRLFGECIAAGCKTIFLEKPGAPTVRACCDYLLFAGVWGKKK